MKKQSTIALCLTIISIAVIFSGCVFVNFGSDATLGDSIQAKGERETYEINTGAFNKIKIEETCDVRYHSGNSGTVTLLVQPNVREYISVETVNGELIVKTTRRIAYGFNKGPVLTVHTPTLNQITFNGAGVFTADDKIVSDSLTININGAASGRAELDVNSLYVIISGAGDLELSGRADVSALTMSGAGSYNAFSLATHDMIINMAGVGSAEVNCSQTLSINANGAGSVEYKGSPSINLNTGGLISIKQVK